MKYYRDSHGLVWAFELDGSQDYLISDDMVQLTPVEVEAHINPKKTYQQALSDLNAIYQKEVDDFNRAFATAYLADGPTQESKQAVIRAQYLARKASHAVDVQNLKDTYASGV